MANTYRLYRNVEASLIQYIEDELVGDWTGITVEKTLANAYKNLPSILVNIANILSVKKEIGNIAYREFPLIPIRIFATDDGQRLDLAKWLFDKIVTGCPYYEYEVEDGAVKTKTLKGRISISRITDNRKELEGMEDLAVEDKYRHVITIEIRVALS